VSHNVLAVNSKQPPFGGSGFARKEGQADKIAPLALRNFFKSSTQPSLFVPHLFKRVNPIFLQTYKRQKRKAVQKPLHPTPGKPLHLFAF